MEIYSQKEHQSLLARQFKPPFTTLEDCFRSVLLMELEAGTTIARMQPVGRLPRFEEPFLSGENRPTGTETFSRSLSVEPIHCRAPTAMLRRYCENLEQATPFPNRSEEFSMTFPGSLAPVVCHHLPPYCPAS